MSEVTLEFAPEVEQALNISEGYVRAEDSKIHKVNFDDKGSIHLVDYDDEGKKLKDYTIGERSSKSKIDTPEGRNQEIIDEINYYKRENKKSKIIFYVIVAILGLGLAASIYVLKSLGG